MDMLDLQYPIGKFQIPDAISIADREQWIETLATFPTSIAAETDHFTTEQLNTRYRPNGWTVRQLVHHCADSHMNALVRVKLALTEDYPTICPYREELWAELHDSTQLPIAMAIDLLHALHFKWVAILRNFSEEDWKRGYVHPVQGREMTLENMTSMYAWHSRHHLAHIIRLKEAQGWE